METIINSCFHFLVHIHLLWFIKININLVDELSFILYADKFASCKINFYKISSFYVLQIHKTFTKNGWLITKIII